MQFQLFFYGNRLLFTIRENENFLRSNIILDDLDFFKLVLVPFIASERIISLSR